jgi:hypothetical protein
VTRFWPGVLDARPVCIFEFKAGSDWNIRWDNTVNLNYMARTEEQDSDVLRQDDGATGGLTNGADLGRKQWDTLAWYPICTRIVSGSFHIWVE